MNRPGILLNPSIPFNRNWLLHLMMGVFVLFWVWMAFSPTDRGQWMLEHILVVAAVLFLGFTYRKFRFTNLSYLLMFIFLCIHTYAAHYTYQQTPFDVWLKESFQTKRSYFDRVVHLLFGLLWVYPVREAVVRQNGLRGAWVYIVPASIVFSMSSLFEIIEMWVAFTAGQTGAQYLGLQGDEFDSIKDMQMELLGVLTTTAVLVWIGWRNKKTNMANQ